MIALILILSTPMWFWVQAPGPSLGYISDVEIVDANGDTLLVSTWHGMSGGIYRSTDGGQHWAISSSGISPQIGYGINHIASSPVDHSYILAGTGFMAPNYIFKSTDGGQNWTSTSYAGGQINDIKFFPGSKDTVLLIAYSGIYKSTDGGNNWIQKYTLTNGRGLCFKHQGPDTIFAAAQTGLFISTNRGEAWSATPFTNRAYDVTVDPEQPDSVYVAGLTNGVFRVMDNGNNYDSLGLGGRYNTTIAFDETNRKIYVGGYAIEGRVCVSADLGQTWYEYRPDQIPDDRINDVEVASGNPNKLVAGCGDAGVVIINLPDSIWHLSSDGIYEGAIRSIAVAPSNPDIIYCGTSYAGIWRSTDGGQTWSSDPKNKSWRKWHNTEYWPVGLAVSPVNPDVAYATFWGWPDSYHAVLKTTDGGQTWEEKTGGLTGIPAGRNFYWIAIHPTGPDTLYLATADGCYKSGDGGENWSQISTQYLYWIEIDPVEPNRLYGTWSGKIFYSEDGGKTWVDRSNGLSNNSEVMMVDVDPRNNNIVYAALCGLEVNDPLSGIYTSTDYGANWERRSNGLPGPPIRRPRVMVDTSLQMIWATTPMLGAGVYSSDDQGMNWYAQNPNLITDRTMFLASGRYPYLGTQGCGLWYFANVSVSEGTRGDASRLRLYPNPARGRFTIELGNSVNEKIEINIFDVTGRRMLNKRLLPIGGIVSVDARSLPAGVYFVRIRAKSINTCQRVVLVD